MKNPLLVPEFREMLASNNINEIIEFCNTTPPAIVADFIGALEPDEIREIIIQLSPETRSAIFSTIDDDIKIALLALFEGGDLVDLIAKMHDNERMNLLGLLPFSRLREIRNLAAPSSEKDVLELIDEIDHFLKREALEEEELSAEEIAGEIHPLIQIYTLQDQKIKKIDRIVKECWVNIINPSKDDISLLAKHFGVPLDFLTASLDIDETARIETEDNATLLIVKVPYFDEQNPDMPYYTLPIGIIIINSVLITICAKEETLLHEFIAGRVKNLTSLTGIRFILQIFFRATLLYLQYLKQINNAANMIQKTLEQETKNQQLIKLMNFEKSLVYFTTSLKTNAVMLERFQRLNPVSDDELENLYEDIIIENKQALEMAEIYSNILSGMMDAFASIISNNLNIVIKFLTSITIIITIPVLVVSFYGMNVKLPLQEHPHGYILVLAVSLLLSISAVLVFIRKKWL